MIPRTGHEKHILVPLSGVTIRCLSLKLAEGTLWQIELSSSECVAFVWIRMSFGFFTSGLEFARRNGRAERSFPLRVARSVNGQRYTADDLPCVRDQRNFFLVVECVYGVGEVLVPGLFLHDWAPCPVRYLFL